MSQIVRARGTRENPYFQSVPRQDGDDNVSWLRAAGRRGPRVVLLGGTSRASVRVRLSQAHASSHMTPSHWSHVAVMADEGELTSSTALYHVWMGPESGIAEDHADNGVEVVPAAKFADRTSWPNVAVIYPEVDASSLASAIDGFRSRRLGADVTPLAVAWLAFVWGNGSRESPMAEGLGVPSAVFAETIFAVAGVPLTPALPHRSTCPEWIWQASRFWHDFHAERAPGRTGLEGAYCVDDDLGPRVSASFIGNA